MPYKPSRYLNPLDLVVAVPGTIVQHKQIAHYLWELNNQLAYNPTIGEASTSSQKTMVEWSTPKCTQCEDQSAPWHDISEYTFEVVWSTVKCCSPLPWESPDRTVNRPRRFLISVVGYFRRFQLGKILFAIFYFFIILSYILSLPYTLLYYSKEILLIGNSLRRAVG